MIPVFQTRFSSADGNCYAACIASVLEIPIEVVPWPSAGEMADVDSWQPYVGRLQDFCHARGFHILMLEHRQGFSPPGYAIAGADTNHGTMHAIVCLDGEIAHDPFPGGMPVSAPRDWTLFVPLDPARLTR